VWCSTQGDSFVDKHTLEIYDTKDRDHPLITFESETPFRTISVGDFLRSHKWATTKAERAEVISVEHDISPISPMWHHTVVFVKPILPFKIEMTKLKGM